MEMEPHEEHVSLGTDTDIQQQGSRSVINLDGFKFGLTGILSTDCSHNAMKKAAIKQ